MEHGWLYENLNEFFACFKMHLGHASLDEDPSSAASTGHAGQAPTRDPVRQARKRQRAARKRQRR
jgi:hypothetical protein